VILAQTRLRALDLAPVLGLAVATALAAQLTIPALPVPFTLQTAAVLASGLLLGPRRGALAQATYLAMGAAGLPVFASLNFGLPTLLGPTAGYLWSFVAVAALTGWAAERWQGWRLALAIFAANLILLTLGTAWLSVVLHHAAWTQGFLPFVPGAVAQSLAAWLVARAARRA